MARFPDSPAPQGNASTPYNFRLSRPLARDGPSWAQKTRVLTRFELLQVELTYAALSQSQVQVLRDFWRTVRGGNDFFTFADFNGFVKNGQPDEQGIEWTDLYVATGDATVQEWTLPTYALRVAVNTDTPPHVTSPIIKVAGTALTALTLSPDESGADGYIEKGGGTDSLDLLHLASAPATSAIVTLTGICRRAMRKARFAGDELPLALRNPANYAGGTLTVIEQVA